MPTAAPACLVSCCQSSRCVLCGMWYKVHVVLSAGLVLSLQPFSDLSAHAMVLIVPVRHWLVSNISRLNAGEATTLGGQIHSYSITWACCVHTLQTEEMGGFCAYMWETSYVKHRLFIKPWIFLFFKCLQLLEVPATSSAHTDQDYQSICLLFWLQARGFRLVLVKLSLCWEGGVPNHSVVSGQYFRMF